MHVFETRISLVEQDLQRPLIGSKLGQFVESRQRLVLLSLNVLKSGRFEQL